MAINNFVISCGLALSVVSFPAFSATDRIQLKPIATVVESSDDELKQRFPDHSSNRKELKTGVKFEPAIKFERPESPRGNVLAIRKFNKLVLSGINRELAIAKCDQASLRSLRAHNIATLMKRYGKELGIADSELPDPALVLYLIRRHPTLCKRNGKTAMLHDVPSNTFSTASANVIRASLRPGDVSNSGRLKPKFKRAKRRTKSRPIARNRRSKTIVRAAAPSKKRHYQFRRPATTAKIRRSHRKPYKFGSVLGSTY